MIQVVETQHFSTETIPEVDGAGAPVLDADGNPVVREIKTLVHTMVETFEYGVSVKLERLMPNGDRYIIQGNVEQYVPVEPTPQKIQYSDFSKMMDVLEWIRVYGALPL